MLRTFQMPSYVSVLGLNIQPLDNDCAVIITSRHMGPAKQNKPPFIPPELFHS